MDYMVAPACGACITMLFEGVFWFCCETPVFLQRTGNRRKAIKAIRYFRGISTPNDDLNRRKFEEELIAMIEQDNSEVRNDEDHSQSDGIKLRSLCKKSVDEHLFCIEFKSCVLYCRCKVNQKSTFNWSRFDGNDPILWHLFCGQLFSCDF